MTNKEHSLTEFIEAKGPGQNRRPGETWQGPSGVWFYKRPDGKVVRVDKNQERSPSKHPTGGQGKKPRGRGYKPPKASQGPAQPSHPATAATGSAGYGLDRTPLRIAQERGMDQNILLRLCLFELDRINKLRSERGELELDVNDLKLRAINPEQATSTRDVSDVMQKVQQIAQRLSFYEEEFFQDYAPIALLDDETTILDGNIRQAAHLVAGLAEMLVLIPRQKVKEQEARAGENFNG